MGQTLKDRLKQRRFRNPRHEVMMNLILASNYVRQMVEEACSEFGITSQQYNILRILRGAAPVGYRCAEIRERMLDRSPDITRRLDTLVEMGLVRRRRSSEDRRAVLSYVTPKGLALLEDLEPYIESIDERVAERLSQRECRDLSTLCEKLYGECVVEVEED